MSTTVTPLQPTSKFEILRRKNGQVNASAQFASTAFTNAGGSIGNWDPQNLPAGVAALMGTETAVRGLGLGAGANGNFALAGSKNFIGHLTRRVIIGGLDLTARVFGVTSPTPVGVESPFTDGLEVSLEKGEEIEAEGVGVYLYSGSNMIDTNTAVGTGLTYQNGLLRVAATDGSEIPFFTLTANNLTPVDTGALRIRAVAN